MWSDFVKKWMSKEFTVLHDNSISGYKKYFKSIISDVTLYITLPSFYNI